jgi:hypothetical protein
VALFYTYFGCTRIALVRAEDPDEARRLFWDRYAARDAAQSSYEWEYLKTKAVNDGYCEQFWLYTQEEKAAFRANGDVIATDDQFKSRVREWFGDEVEFAEMYLNAYFEDPESVMIESKLPTALLAYVLREEEGSYMSLHVFETSKFQRISKG